MLQGALAFPRGKDPAFLASLALGSLNNTAASRSSSTNVGKSCGYLVIDRLLCDEADLIGFIHDPTIFCIHS